MRKLNRAILLTSTLIASAIGGAAMAQDAAKDTDNTDVTDQAVKTIIIHAERSKAAATAPSKASLDQGEPQSIVSRPFIETSIPETADFTYIANITPSASGSGSSNGPGFGEAKTTLRGFKDGNYNVTFDAIPWGDTNNPTHHSNSFFPASTVGATIVDRGPGAVGDLGQANYGGNIKMFSNKVTDDSSLTLRETIGSWNSWQSVAVYQTGKIAQLHDLKGFINLQMNGSDGALTYSKMHSGNATTKWVLPISENWNLTLFGMYNANEWHNSDNPGGTAYQIKTYGKNFLLNNDPNSPAYYGYNVFNKHTVFSYAKLEGELPLGFKMDNTVYNIYYSNNTDTGLNLAADSSLISTSNPGGYTGLGTYISTSAATGGSADHKYNASGYNKLNHYMTWGDMLRFKREFSAGLMHAGIWVETAKTNRHTYDYDLYLNRAPDHREKKYCMVYSGTTCTTYGTTDLDTYAYQEQSNWWQMQTYADFEWHVTDALTVTPGVKYVSMKRNVMAPVIKSPRQVQYASNKNTATLKNLSVNYKLAHNWSVYGQYAEGMYLPDIAALYVINPSTNTAEPTSPIFWRQQLTRTLMSISARLRRTVSKAKSLMPSTMV